MRGLARWQRLNSGARYDYAGDGETVIGYTYSCYKNQHDVVDGPDEPLTTDGGTDLAEFPADMRLLASRPYNTRR
jgi:hypothetical protein